MAFLLFVIFAFTTACTSDQGGSSADTHNQTSTPVERASFQTERKPRVKTQAVIGERIDGPANVRDAVNGKLLFSLEDHVLVACTPLEGDWYKVGVQMEIKKEEFGIDRLQKGRKILVDGKEVGEILAETEVVTGMGKHAWAELIGYTHKDNIKPSSIIENVLQSYLQTDGNSRMMQDFKPFIQQFELELTDQFEGYQIYYNYENWIEDPSPMWRIGLVFQENKLVAILHSRPLSIPNTENHPLDRGFDCLTYNDFEKAKETVALFDTFVNSVD
jgi:hypothetical protein